MFWHAVDVVVTVISETEFVADARRKGVILAQRKQVIRGPAAY